MARLRPEDDILIAEMKAGGATLQEIANAFGISKHAAWLHTKKSREIIRELKKSVLMHYLDEAQQHRPNQPADDTAGQQEPYDGVIIDDKTAEII